MGELAPENFKSLVFAAGSDSKGWSENIIIFEIRLYTKVNQKSFIWSCLLDIQTFNSSRKGFGIFKIKPNEKFKIEYYFDY